MVQPNAELVHHMGKAIDVGTAGSIATLRGGVGKPWRQLTSQLAFFIVRRHVELVDYAKEPGTPMRVDRKVEKAKEREDGQPCDSSPAAAKQQIHADHRRRNAADPERDEAAVDEEAAQPGAMQHCRHDRRTSTHLGRLWDLRLPLRRHGVSRSKVARKRRPTQPRHALFT